MMQKILSTIGEVIEALGHKRTQGLIVLVGGFIGDQMGWTSADVAKIIEALGLLWAGIGQVAKDSRAEKAATPTP